LAERPLTLRREGSVRAATGLAFPGKVLADAETRRLYVADSNHNRVIIAELPDATGIARVLRVVGSGEAGSTDGPAESASFRHPQGMAIGQGNLYVADTENNLIRAIDLSSHEVTTIVGTGEMSNDRFGGAMGVQQGINWPWDIAIEGATLYVAMAGTHQIWRIDLPVGFARALAGNGRENIVDGPNETAALAQPSGICVAGGTIYFADSEVSAIRGVDMAAERVFTVIGEGLFSFGDVDGEHPKAKLQHPLGVDAWHNVLLVADSYNHKIKLVDPGARSVRTLLGIGSPGASTDDGKLALFEPGGLSVYGDDLYIADTNNHRVVRVHLESHEWREVSLVGLAPPPNRAHAATDETHAAADRIRCDPVAVSGGAEIELALDIALPSGAHLSSEAPWSIRVSRGVDTIAQHTGRSDAMPLRIRIPAGGGEAGSTWEVTAALAYCTDSEGGVCVPAEIRWSIPVGPGDATSITIAARVASDA
jgi:sugar lactone lactonase YvrE